MLVHGKQESHNSRDKNRFGQQAVRRYNNFPVRVVPLQHHIRIFLHDEPEAVDQVLYYGVPALRFMCIAVVIQPVSVVANMLFQSIGKAGVSSFLSSLRSGLCYIPCLIILPLFLGFTGIQCSQMCADILSALISVPFLIGFFKGLPGEDMHTEQDDKYEEYSKNGPDIGVRTA